MGTGVGPRGPQDTQLAASGRSKPGAWHLQSPQRLWKGCAGQGAELMELGQVLVSGAWQQPHKDPGDLNSSGRDGEKWGLLHTPKLVLMISKTSCSDEALDRTAQPSRQQPHTSLRSQPDTQEVGPSGCLCTLSEQH